MTEKKEREPSDRCYWSLGKQQKQWDRSEGDFHRLETLIYTGQRERGLSKLLQKSEWEYRLFTEV